MSATFRAGLLFILAIVAIGVIYRLLLAYHGLTVTSWWRSFWHNAEVGGMKTSLHQLGLAFDVLPVTAETEQTLRGLGLNILNEGDHIHAQIGF